MSIDTLIDEMQPFGLEEKMSDFLEKLENFANFGLLGPENFRYKKHFPNYSYWYVLSRQF